MDYRRVLGKRSYDEDTIVELMQEDKVLMGLDDLIQVPMSNVVWIWILRGCCVTIRST